MPASINSTSSSPGGLVTTGDVDNELVIQTGDVTAISIDASQNVTFAGAVSTSGAVSATTLTVNSNNISADNSLGFRNRIINGDMRIDQRNAGASVTIGSASLYNVDRWIARTITSPSSTVQRSSDAPSGFTNSILVTVGTGATPSTTQDNHVRQLIEGFNIADLGWGTASAKTVTVSFLVRCSLTGTFGGSLRNDGSSRSYPFTYSISAVNTWEHKTITIPGDTSGTWLTNNGIGLVVTFSLGMGATYLGPAGAWAGTDYRGATGETNVVATTGATFQITGVQLEVGSVATPFERRPYGTELALCQRYYELYDGGVLFLTKLRESDRNRRGNFFFKVTKRAAATITLITSSTDGGGAIGATGGIDGGNFESLSTSDAQTPNVTKFSAQAEL